MNPETPAQKKQSARFEIFLLSMEKMMPGFGHLKKPENGHFLHLTIFTFYLSFVKN